MTGEQAKSALRGMFQRTVHGLAVAPRMRQALRLRDGVLEIGREDHGGLDRIPLHSGRPVRVIAIGKAAVGMAHTLHELLPGVSLHGIVSAPEPPANALAGFEYFQGGHPLPNQQSLLAAKAALALLDQKNVREQDLVIFLISGGGSALMEHPPDYMFKLEDVQSFNQELVTSGATIWEINALRKHFSRVKGGRLAKAAAPARQLTLYVSDVPKGMDSVIASGPSMPDEATVTDCYLIWEKYEFSSKAPAVYVKYFESYPSMRWVTPKAPDACFAQSIYHCLLSNRDGVDQLADLARENGWLVHIDCGCDDWDYRRAAGYLLDRLGVLRAENPGAPVALISGGELSCPVVGDGAGGRNQAFVLECVRKISGLPIAVLSAGTDGIDGNSPAAGAVADGESLNRATAMGTDMGMDPDDFARRSDSFHFFEQLGDTILTGPTGTNVRDLRILLDYSSDSDGK